MRPQTQSKQNWFFSSASCERGLQQEAALAYELARTPGLDLVRVPTLVDVDDLVLFLVFLVVSGSDPVFEDRVEVGLDVVGVDVLEIVLLTFLVAGLGRPGRDRGRLLLDLLLERVLDGVLVDQLFFVDEILVEVLFVALEVRLVEVGVVEIGLVVLVVLVVVDDVVLGVLWHVVLVLRSHIGWACGPGGYTPRRRAPPRGQHECSREKQPRGVGTLRSFPRPGRIAQLVRALPSHGRGHKFESCCAHRLDGLD